MSSLGNINGNQTVQQQKGIKYDKNEINEAMKKEGSTFYEIANENGYFIEIFDSETNTAHLLCDRDFDGLFDDYRRTEYYENGESRAYDDDDFDGTFDRTIDFKDIANEDGSFTVLAAFDNDADGQIDFYDHEHFTIEEQ